ncbi:MAG TPA: DUF2142 domain-containing protein [Anaerolineae bacterium]|nr:DUF2142 domain-containing protein [Anaerolineae bacterium]
MSSRPHAGTSDRILLFLILAVYLVLGGLYALLTPLWQAPDEPAHFNNIAVIAQTGHLPVLQPGDYDQAYLEKLKRERFPPHLSITRVRYEGHQPPLYYSLMAPLWGALQSAGVRGQVWVLRWVNVLIGAGALCWLWLAVRRLFPRRPRLGLLAVGFAAFLPMHVAMNASINNDALAEFFIAVVMWRLLGHVMESATSGRAWAITGAMVGLALLTKFQTYFLAPLALGVWGWQVMDGMRGARAWRTAMALLLPMLLLPLPWWLRNMAHYGPTDPFGLDRHAAVVVGQPRTVDWIASQGWSAFLDRFVTFTFRSFWGVFGWMGVFMDARIYMLLTLLSGLILAGVFFQLWRWRKGMLQLRPVQIRGGWLLLAQLVAVTGAFLWYNLDFVQHQGRYLFPALLPISLLAAAGLMGVFSVEGSRWGMTAVGVYFIAILGLGWRSGQMNKWGVLLSILAMGMMVGRRWLARVDAFWWGLAAEGVMACVALYGLFGAILPQLG